MYFVSNSFRGKVNNDNTELFVINTENCPSTIEDIYSYLTYQTILKCYQLIQLHFLNILVIKTKRQDRHFHLING